MINGQCFRLHVCLLFHRNEEFYNDIATSVQTHTKEILKEKNEILRRLEEIEGAEQQV